MMRRLRWYSGSLYGLAIGFLSCVQDFYARARLFFIYNLSP
jgi:hypothetical protein